MIILSTGKFLFAQNTEKAAPKTNLIVGNAVTFIPIERINFNQPPSFYSEWVWTLTFAMDFSNYYRPALEHKLVLLTNKYETTQVMNIAGLTHQFNFMGFLKKAEERLVLEFGLHYGNYCKCTPPQKVPKGVLYYSFGGGGAIRLSPKFDLDLGFNMLKPIGSQYKGGVANMFQYILGIDYYFRARPSRKIKENPWF